MGQISLTTPMAAGSVLSNVQQTIRIVRAVRSKVEETPSHELQAVEKATGLDIAAKMVEFPAKHAKPEN
ncbi:hypothetical protein GCM10011363_27670 [Marivita lacus]|uniref:Uncharacterized protein n=1 Tax=Marivita lacus TaxID=1323742 RepID=A0ABQ1KV59_9RHOB|nr:hypothetical protein GCM10011363_27670 [Marivita lacus]